MCYKVCVFVCFHAPQVKESERKEIASQTDKTASGSDSCSRDCSSSINQVTKCHFCEIDSTILRLLKHTHTSFQKEVCGSKHFTSILKHTVNAKSLDIKFCWCDSGDIVHTRIHSHTLPRLCLHHKKRTVYCHLSL